jgi:catechol 2,3-dioxygenase-like lactoylglutathione lyase family enzyme
MLSLEVIPIPVTDVDRGLTFYTEQVGFKLDIDYQPSAEFRVVQLTPPGSACSIHLVAAESSHRLHGLQLVTTDLAAERAALIGRGVEVGPIRHKQPTDTWAGDFAPGIDPGHRDYASFADLSDPDGNTWILQERAYRTP